jgi:hypothetical protein
MKQVKNIVCVLVIVFFLLIIGSSSVLAHPASNVDLAYDFDNQTLDVTITHVVNDPNSHYIEKLEVYKNGVTIKEEDYTIQPSNGTYTVSLEIPAEDGDVLKVETECILGGKTEDSITVSVGDNGSSTDQDDSSTPGFELLIILISIGTVVLIKIKTKS